MSRPKAKVDPPDQPLRAIDRPAWWSVRPGLRAGFLTLALPSALAGSQPRLEQVGYREALGWFHSQQYDDPGSWICGYSLAREDYSVAPKAPRLLVEVAQRFLYLKTGGQLLELTGADDQAFAQSCRRVP
ncbi:hypothetical protein [Pseudomonas sp. MSSRFD41]|uniref:hypothetical protein n=1 Tax=Pseudomonas sp. MSSRFD41 TaxID=1310370 RepID=UPI0021AD91C5|nr:hypothetical protein [Pseudomonas sp. MSSRFD41]